MEHVRSCSASGVTTSLRYLAFVQTRPGGQHVRRLSTVSTPPPPPPALSRATSVLGQESGDGLTRPGVPGVPSARQLAPGDGEARLTSSRGDTGAQPDW